MDGGAVEQEMSSAELPSPHTGVQRTLARNCGNLASDADVTAARPAAANQRGAVGGAKLPGGQTPRAGGQRHRRQGENVILKALYTEEKKEFTSNDDVEKRGIGTTPVPVCS